MTGFPFVKTGWLGTFVASAIASIVLTASVSADMRGHGGLVRSLAMSPDGGRIITASFDYTARVFDFVEHKELGVLEGHEGPVNNALFLPDGERALTASADGTLVLWNLKSFSPAATLKGHENRVQDVAISPDGRLAVSAGWDARAILWDLESGEARLSVKLPVAVTGVAFADGGETFITGSRDGMVRWWRVSDGIALGKFQAHGLGLAHFKVSADGSRLITAGLNEPVRLWDWRRQEMIGEYQFFRGNPTAVALAPDGTTALAADRSGTFYHFDLESGRQLMSLAAHRGPVWSAAVVRDGIFAVTAGGDEVVRVWHLETGERVSFGADDEGRPRLWLTSDHPGARPFRKCAGCHALTAAEPERSGPHFEGIIGRPAGAVAGYRYSAALDKADYKWDAEHLKALFREGPDKFLPGTRMPVQRITDEETLEHLVDYIRLVTGGG